MKRGRGRPRQYDESEALQAAAAVFWTKGFSATSLDDLAAAMGMNRPSIYRAFGEKEAIYRKALAQFTLGMEAAFANTLLAEADIRVGLTSFYQQALTVYTSGEQAKGCLVMSTAVAAAIAHPEIRNDLLAVIHGLDEKFTLRFQQALDAKQVSHATPASARAAIAQSVLHSLSLRARAGESPSQLRDLINSGVDVLVV